MFISIKAYSYIFDVSNTFNKKIQKKLERSNSSLYYSMNINKFKIKIMDLIKNNTNFRVTFIKYEIFDVY